MIPKALVTKIYSAKNAVLLTETYCFEQKLNCILKVFYENTIPSEKKVMGLERGPPSLVSTTEELLDRKVAAPV
jgi:hypothetical protein